LILERDNKSAAIALPMLGKSVSLDGIFILGAMGRLKNINPTNELQAGI
jgi:hypothetical protein